MEPSSYDVTISKAVIFLNFVRLWHLLALFLGPHFYPSDNTEPWLDCVVFRVSNEAKKCKKKPQNKNPQRQTNKLLF